MKTGDFRKLLILIVLIALISTLSCSAGRDVYEVSSIAVDSFSDLILPDEKPVLKKKILIAPVINKAGFSDLQAEEIKQDCISYLSKDKYLLITSVKKIGDGESVSLLKQYGTVTNPEYVKTAEEMGMNIFLTCIVNPIEVTEKRTGIWPLRKDSYKVLVSISINALDTVNGTYIVFEDRTANIKIKKEDTGAADKWIPDYNMLKSDISSVIKKLCSDVVEKLRKQHWESKVTVDNDNIVIQAGTDIGIKENTVFEVYKKGEPIESLYKDEYYTFGEKIGEAGIKSLSENKTVLAATINGDIKDAAFIRVKRSND